MDIGHEVGAKIGIQNADMDTVNVAKIMTSYCVDRMAFLLASMWLILMLEYQ